MEEQSKGPRGRDALEALDIMLVNSHTTPYRLSLRMGKNGTYVSSLFQHDSIPRVDTFCRMAHALGYEVIVRKPAGETIRLTFDRTRPKEGLRKTSASKRKS